MRSRRFITALAVAALGLVAFAPGASAQELDRDRVQAEAEAIMDEAGTNKYDADCVGILLDGGSMEDCRDAPNALMPALYELVWGAVGFVVVFVFLWKFGLPAARRAMQNRSEKIREDIDAAERARTDAETVRSEYENSLGDAKAEAARIIEEARQAADQLKADQQTRLNDELAAARVQAQSEIDAAKSQAMAELRGEVADIAIGAAEAVVGANLDRNAQTQLIEDYINSVGVNGQA